MKRFIQLNVKTNTFKSNKIRSKTPLLFALSEEQKKMLIEVPRKALEAFSNSSGTIQNWEALMFRMVLCYEIAKDFYVEQTQQEVLEVVDALNAVFDRYSKNGSFHMSNDDLELVAIGLDAMDTMQTQMTRKEMLNASYRTKEYMRKYATNQQQKVT